MIFRAALALGLALAAGGAGATTLTFDQSAPNTPASDFAQLSQAYGDNVASTSQGGFTYAIGAEGATPDVTLSYLSADISTWTTGYGDLTNIIFEDVDGTDLVLQLLAAPGWEVGLLSFDLSSYFQTDRTIATVRVSPASGPDTVFTDVLVQGALDGTAHTTLGFGAGLFSTALTLTLDVSGLGGASDDIGLDNLTFMQRAVETAVPLPAAAPLLAAALGGLALAARRRRAG